MWDPYQVTLGNNLQMPAPLKYARRGYAFIPSSNTWYIWSSGLSTNKSTGWVWMSTDKVPKQHLAAALLLT